MSVRARLAALAIVFLLAHLPFLPSTLEDVDSLNFAFGVREFDVARHQPHPPGYPVFIALSKLSTAIARAAGVHAAEARGLSIWSAVFGAALIPLLFLFFRALSDERRAWWATLAVTGAPLVWFTALRPLSDTTGLAFAVAAQALLTAVIVGRAGARTLAAGAFLATLAVGVRSQSFVLTLPLLLWALALPGGTIALRDRAIAFAAAIAGGLLWAIPLVVASGGLASYMAALGTQAGEDFSGVVILWTMRSARIAAQALVYTFLWPWGTPWLGAIVLAIGVAGALLVLRQAPRTALLLGVAFVPYAAFHLLFHEIVTVRYAMPLVVPVAYLFVVAVDASAWQPSRGRLTKGPNGGSGFPHRWRHLLPFASAALCAAGVVQAARPSRIYARDGSPAFRAFEDARSDRGRGNERPAIAMHAFARRTADWLGDSLERRVLVARHGVEWMAAVEELRRSATVLFVADPRRTDLALFDPRSLTHVASHRWGFVESPFVGGARPGNVDLYRIDAPGWMLDRGWALTAEAGGVSEREGWGPHRRPSVAWIRRRDEPALALIGGRHLGASGDPPAEVIVTIGDRRVERWTASPGFFVNRFELPAGTLQHAESYVPLHVTTRAADGTGRQVRVGLEQFDVQNSGVPMFALEEGWQEPEYNPMTAARWRWMSDRAVLWVRPIGRDVTLELSGESPLRYYDRAPVLRARIGEDQVAQFGPSADFVQEILLPDVALAAADGRVVLTSDQYFVPGEREGSPDKRRLAVRIYGITVK